MSSPGRSSWVAGELRAPAQLAQRDAGGVADGAAGPGTERGQLGDQGSRGVPGEAGRPDVGKLRRSRADLRARRRCVRAAGRCTAPALSARVEAIQQLPVAPAEVVAVLLARRPAPCHPGILYVGALGFNGEDDRVLGCNFEEIGNSYTDNGIGIELYYDVAVIGGGAVGLAYEIRVKRDNPELRVLVLEKAKEPRFKIGESTLSVTVEHLLELGFTMPQLRRLFTIKSGLGFWSADSATAELVSPVDVCNTEETFQVERRPMDIALPVRAQVSAGPAGAGARDAGFVRGRGPGSLPGGLRRERSCLGAGTFPGNVPQAGTHQHECVLVALPENGIAGDTGLRRLDDTPHLLPAGLVLVHQPVFLGELSHAQSDRDDRCPAQGPPRRRGHAGSPGMGEPVRLHAVTARLDRRVTPVGPGLSAARRGTGAVLALRRRLPGHPEDHA